MDSKLQGTFTDEERAKSQSHIHSLREYNQDEKNPRIKSSRAHLCDMFATQAWPGVSIPNAKFWKCRAETGGDVVSVSEINTQTTRMRIKEATMDAHGDAEVIVESASDVTIRTIRTWFRKVEDTHVMRQTLRPFDEYTGIRDESVM
jgi:hypothetical protein